MAKHTLWCSLKPASHEVWLPRRGNRPSSLTKALSFIHRRICLILLIWDVIRKDTENWTQRHTSRNKIVENVHSNICTYTFLSDPFPFLDCTCNSDIGTTISPHSPFTCTSVILIFTKGKSNIILDIIAILQAILLWQPVPRPWVKLFIIPKGGRGHRKGIVSQRQFLLSSWLVYFLLRVKSVSISTRKKGKTPK